MSFTATHRVSDRKAATWTEPDATQADGPHLDGQLPVLVHRRWGDWRPADTARRGGRR